MQREIQIPAASMQRVRANYAQLEAMVTLIAEALGIPPQVPRNLDLERGVFTVEMPEQHGPVNGKVLDAVVG